MKKRFVKIADFEGNKEECQIPFLSLLTGGMVIIVSPDEERKKPAPTPAPARKMREKTKLFRKPPYLRKSTFRMR